MKKRELRELVSNTVIVTNVAKGHLPKPISADDIKKNPDLKPVAIMGANTYAIQLYHICDQRREVKQASMEEKDREELLAGLKAKFDAIKAEAHYLFPDSVMFKDGNTAPTPY